MRLLSCTPGPKWLRRLLRAMCNTLGQGGSASIRVDIAGGHATVPRHEKRTTSDVSNVRSDNIGGQETIVARTLRCTSKDANECRAVALRQCRDAPSPPRTYLSLLHDQHPCVCGRTSESPRKITTPKHMLEGSSAVGTGPIYATLLCVSIPSMSHANYRRTFSAEAFASTRQLIVINKGEKVPMFCSQHTLVSFIPPTQAGTKS